MEELLVLAAVASALAMFTLSQLASLDGRGAGLAAAPFAQAEIISSPASRPQGRAPGAGLGTGRGAAVRGRSDGDAADGPVSAQVLARYRALAQELEALR